MSLRFSVSGIGLAGGGLGGWTHCRQWLESENSPGDPDIPVSSLLSARERRRSPLTVRQALAVAEQACGMASVAPDKLPGVFTSGMGDLDISHYMCGILAESPELISPTKFHNSVHNAAAGYWSIGAGTHADVTALCAYDDSFAAGLLEAASRCVLNDEPVLLVCYDIPAKGLLEEVWKVEQAFAGALVISPAGRAFQRRREGKGGFAEGKEALAWSRNASRPSALERASHKRALETVGGAFQPRHPMSDSAPGSTLELRLSDSAPHTPELPEPLHKLARDNPAARMLYLLAMIAGGEERMVLETRQGPNLELCRV